VYNPSLWKGLWKPLTVPLAGASNLSHFSEVWKAGIIVYRIVSFIVSHRPRLCPFDLNSQTS